jgi:hypothetical protein
VDGAWPEREHSAGGWDATHFTRAGRVAYSIVDVVTRYWIGYLLSSEQTSTQAQLLFARALADQHLLDQDGRPLAAAEDEAGDEDRLPVLIAWSDNGTEMTAIDMRKFMALMAIAQHHGRPGTRTDRRSGIVPSATSSRSPAASTTSCRISTAGSRWSRRSRSRPKIGMNAALARTVRHPWSHHRRDQARHASKSAGRTRGELQGRDRPAEAPGLAAWAADLGLPRRAFCLVAGEAKPVYVDFQSPALVRNLHRMLGRATTASPDVAVRFTEMLPSPEQCWLEQGGHRYTSELRLVAVDRTRRGQGSLAR